MMILWELCKRLKFCHANKQYMLKPESVQENYKHGFPWDFKKKFLNNVDQRQLPFWYTAIYIYICVCVCVYVCVCISKILLIHPIHIYSYWGVSKIFLFVINWILDESKFLWVFKTYVMFYMWLLSMMRVIQKVFLRWSLNHLRPWWWQLPWYEHPGKQTAMGADWSHWTKYSSRVSIAEGIGKF